MPQSLSRWVLAEFIEKNIVWKKKLLKINWRIMIIYIFWSTMVCFMVHYLHNNLVPFFNVMKRSHMARHMNVWAWQPHSDSGERKKAFSLTERERSLVWNGNKTCQVRSPFWTQIYCIFFCTQICCGVMVGNEKRVVLHIIWLGSNFVGRLLLMLPWELKVDLLGSSAVFISLSTSWFGLFFGLFQTNEFVRFSFRKLAFVLSNRLDLWIAT